MKIDHLITIAAAISCGCAGIVFGFIAGGTKEDVKWQQRTREAGFYLVTRYDVMTGEGKQVLIKLPKTEATP